jgi:hypothetical protein
MRPARQETAEERLARFFRRNGYLRMPNPARRKEERSKYKKGYEVRLVLRSEGELEEARELLVQTGFKPARPFRKVRRLIQPIYGKRAVEQFLWRVGGTAGKRALRRLRRLTTPRSRRRPPQGAS